MKKLLPCLLAALLPVLAFEPADGAAALEPSEFVIGYLEGDWSSQEEWNTHPADMGRLLEYVPRRPIDGAELGVSDAQYLGRGMKIRYVLERRRGKNAAELLAALKALKEEKGVRVFLVDAQGPDVAELAGASAAMDVLLLNISAFDDSLRNEGCRKHLFHILPSTSMLTDALAQYLVFKKWLRVLVLQGPFDEDAKMVAAFKRSAKRFGLKIAKLRNFVLTQDPRAREVNRVEQLTAGANDLYDVVFVADAHAEFAYRVPYHTVHPRPVVGSAGLTPRAWHWSYLRHGAPQVNSRFEKRFSRRMRDRDWAAMVAVKAVSEAVLRTGSVELEKIIGHLGKQDLKLDGFKRGGYSFRPWNNQLRQRILLATGNWVASVPPLKAFLHASDDLDTLGFDEPESACRLRR